METTEEYDSKESTSGSSCYWWVCYIKNALGQKKICWNQWRFKKIILMVETLSAFTLLSLALQRPETSVLDGAIESIYQ